MRLVLTLLLATAALLVPQSPASADEEPKFETYAVDVGTGLAVYVEIPSSKQGERPFRIVMDTGKGQSSGLSNDLVSFLVSEEIGLKPASGDFEGDVIDYFVLSHPHEDHFNGAKPLMAMFDVRNVIESKQLSSPRYLRQFKADAINEIAAAKAAGKEAHYYVVGLPYPNGFDQPRGGEPYDEYALCEQNLPAFMRDAVDPRKFQGKVNFPFGPDEVTQVVEWPVKHLMGGDAKLLKMVDEAYRSGSLEVDVIPVGTHFALGRNGGFTILHADTIAAFEPANTSNDTYKEAWPYYKESDLNDGSVSIRVQYKNASAFIPGDTEGRSEKPTKLVSLVQIFGSGTGQEAYSKEDIEKHLRRDRPAAEQLPVIPAAERYIMGSEEIRKLAYYAYVTLDKISPEAFEVSAGGETFEIDAKEFGSPADIDESVIQWDKRSSLLRATVMPNWRERLFALHRDLVLNNQKFDGLKNRFVSWVRAAKPRLVWNDDEEQFKLDFEQKRWNLITLIQIAERLYYVDPGLANIFAGFIISSDLYLDYMAPKEQSERALRGERHMIDVAEQIKAESGLDVLKSDVLFFGHHGSYTSSSYEFVHRVNPNVGIISADDKSYSGSTLPDFSALFWNLNSKHPKARAILHSVFFHADLLARKRGQPVDEYAEKNRYSASAARVFRARGMWPIPIWRTDFNDDLVNKNTLVDNIAIVTSGETPIWAWAKDRSREPFNDRMIEEDINNKTDRFPYWSQELVSANPSGSRAIRPHDPSGEMWTFSVGSRLDTSSVEKLDAVFGPESYREAEDWTRDTQDLDLY